MFALVVRIFISSSISCVLLLEPTSVNAINQQSRVVVPLSVNIHQKQVRTLEPFTTEDATTTYLIFKERCEYNVLRRNKVLRKYVEYVQYHFLMKFF